MAASVFPQNGRDVATATTVATIPRWLTLQLLQHCNGRWLIVATVAAVAISRPIVARRLMGEVACGWLSLTSTAVPYRPKLAKAISHYGRCNCCNTQRPQRPLNRYSCCSVVTLRPIASADVGRCPTSAKAFGRKVATAAPLQK